MIYPNIVYIFILYFQIVNAFSLPILRLSLQNNDLLVIGASITGIGGRIIKSHRRLYPNARIIGETLTLKNHDDLRKLNCIPMLCNESDINDKFSNIVITVPAYRSSNIEYNEYYKSIVKNAILRWNKNGKLVFASSGGVYLENNGNYVSEDSDTNKEHLLYDCEKIIQDAGGTSLRLSALYGFNKGDLWGYLKQSHININPNMIIEMCNYDDACSAFMTILESNKNVSGEIYNICDGKSKTVKEILMNCLKIYEYKKFQLPTMSVNNTNLGKKYNITKITNLGWSPRWKSFETWCRTYSQIENPKTNAIQFYENYKKEDIIHDVGEIGNQINETILIISQILVFVIIEAYLYIAPYK